MAKRNDPKQPRNNLESGEKLSSISAVTNVTTYFPPIEKGEKREGKYIQDIGIGKQAVTAATPPTQKWTPGERVQVGHPIPAKKFVALNEEGTQRIGEDHPRARLSDQDVEDIRDEYEAHPIGHAWHVGYRALAKKWGVNPSTICKIVTYQRRNQWAGRWKRVA